MLCTGPLWAGGWLGGANFLRLLSSELRRARADSQREKVSRGSCTEGGRNKENPRRGSGRRSFWEVKRLGAKLSTTGFSTIFLLPYCPLPPAHSLPFPLVIPTAWSVSSQRCVGEWSDCRRGALVSLGVSVFGPFEGVLISLRGMELIHNDQISGVWS